MYVFEIDTGLHYSQAYASTIEINRERSFGSIPWVMHFRMRIRMRMPCAPWVGVSSSPTHPSIDPFRRTTRTCAGRSWESVDLWLSHEPRLRRYLRHTPSNSSLDLQLEEQKEEQPEQQQQQQATPRKQQVLQQATPRKQQVQQRIPTPSRYHPCSISLGSKLEGNYHSVVIMEPPHDDFPIVKWDINGNSLDDDACDRWDDFEARWRQAAAATRSLSQSQKSSHQSSSCTLETWVDDTEPLSLELHRHDNAVGGNNCNLCLRSFWDRKRTLGGFVTSTLRPAIEHENQSCENYLHTSILYIYVIEYLSR